MKLKTICTVVITTLVFFCAEAQQTSKMTPGGIGFLQYLPDGYNTNSNKYPVVVSLHGIKEKGNTLSEVTRVANVGLPKYVKYGQKYNFILISPQLKTTMGRWTGDYIMQVLNYIKTYLRVDPARVYLTGLSLGGGGVWSVATAYPSVWAAILPICSGYNLTGSAYKIAGSNIPVWGFHGDADNIVSEAVTINMVNAINNSSPKPSPLSKVTIFPGLGHIIWDKVYKETSALSWMLQYRNGTTSTTTNTAPVAKAGTDKTVTLPTNAATLYGGGNDSDGSITAYSWRKKSGGNASLSGTSSKDLKVSNMAEGTYTFSLTVKDDKGATASDDVNVYVKNGTTTTNLVPVANAGSDRLLVLPTTSIAITASAYDKDGSIAYWKWTKVSGPSAYIYSSTTSTLKVSSLSSGTYVFRVTVKDNKGAVDTDDVVVNVTHRPTVHAGSDRTVTLPLSSLTLTASASDQDGNITSYRWSKSSGPVLRMTNYSTRTVTLSNFYEGTYVIKIAVKDNKGAAAYDYVKIIVKDSYATIQYLGENPDVITSIATI